MRCTRVFTILLALTALFFSTVASNCNPGPSKQLIVPRVMLTLPAPGSSGVPVNTTVSFTLNKELLDSSVTAQSFTLVETATSAPVTSATRASVAGGSIELRQPLKALTSYTTTIATAVFDTDGQAIAQPYSWTFTTGRADSNVAPAPVQAAPLANAPTTAIISVSFDRDLDPATLQPATFFVTDNATHQPIAGSLSYEHRLAVFTPDATLAAGSSYTAKLTVAVRGDNGVPLASEISWTFRAHVPQLTAAQDLVPFGGAGAVPLPQDAYAPALAIDEVGNMMMVYATPAASTSSHLVSRRYSAQDDAWETPLQLESTTGFPWIEQLVPLLSLDRHGNALAVWIGTDQKLYSSSLSKTDTAWSAPLVLEANKVQTYNGGADADGNLAVVWTTIIPTQPPVASQDQTHNILLNRFSAVSQSWGTALKINSAPLKGIASYAKLGVAANGTALVEYQDGVTLFSRRFTPSTGAWAAPVTIGVLGGNQTVLLNRALDYAGNAVAGFWRADMVNSKPLNRYYLSRFDHLTETWSAPELVFESTEFSSLIAYSQLALNPLGDVTTVFVTHVDAGDRYVYRSRDYSAGEGQWLDVQTGLDLQSSPLHDAYGDFGFGIDARGNVLAVEPYTPLGPYVSQRPAGTDAWPTPLFYETKTPEQWIYSTQVAENRSGQAGVCYALYDSSATKKYFVRGFQLK